MFSVSIRRSWRLGSQLSKRAIRHKPTSLQSQLGRRAASYQNFPDRAGGGQYSRFGGGTGSSGGSGGRKPYSRFPPIARLQFVWRNYQNLIILFGGGGVAIYVFNLEQTPITGRWRFNIVSPDMEKSTGSSTYQAVLSEYRNQILPADHPYTRLTAHVVERLLPTISNVDPNESWQVHVIDDPKVPNAFVLPGGQVFVFTGIFPFAQDENGLAAVIGHEMAHNIAHHVGEKLSSQIITTAATLILSLVFDISGQLGNSISELALTLPNSRAQETEADYIGLLMMAEACYDPRRAPQIWERMVAYERQQGGAPPALMSTHPASASRAQTMQKWMPEAMDKYESGNCSVTARGLEEFKKIVDIGRRSRARPSFVGISQPSRDNDDDWPF